MKRDNITKDKLRLIKRLAKFRTIRNGKVVYSYAKALSMPQPHRKTTWRCHDPVIERICNKHGWTATDVAKIVSEMSGRIEKHGLRVLEPANDPYGVVWTKDVFGDLKLWERLRREITNLVLAGESMDDHARRLQRKYHLYPDIRNRPGIRSKDRNVIVKSEWTDVAEQYKDVTPEQRAWELEWRRNVGLYKPPVPKKS